MSVNTIISVEDSDTDFLALQHALKAAGVTNPLERCENGKIAAGRLLADYEALAERASLIMLDLNLPGYDGRDLLRKVRALDPERRVPIIVLSTSSHPKDIDNCYRAGADAYMVKPLELEDWETSVGQLAQTWLRPADLSKECGRVELNEASLPMDDPLSRVIEGEIIPRLLLAHGAFAAGSDEPVPSQGLLIGEEEVSQLTSLILTQDVSVAAAYVESIRAQGATVGYLYLSLLAPAAQLAGEWWRADRCDFTELSLGLSRLQRLMRDMAPFDAPTTH